MGVGACMYMRVHTHTHTHIQREKCLKQWRQKQGKKSRVLTQSQAALVTSRAWFVVSHEHAVTVLEELLLYKAGIPHFNFL